MTNKLKSNIKKNKLLYLRTISQILFFIFLPSVFTSAFNGVKYFFTQMNLKMSVELTSFLVVLITLCVFTIVFGRFFCGFSCAFGALGDWLNRFYVFVCKKLKKKPIKISKKITKLLLYLKYIVLLLIVLACYFGLYASLKGYNPWEVFSVIRSGSFRLSGYALGIAIFIVLLFFMTIHERFFCKFICPMGAVFSLLPILPLFSLHRNRENCIKGCRACEMKCPADVVLPDNNESKICGDCIMCQKCISTCPKKNISTKSGLKGNEVWFTILRCVILAILLVIIGV